MNEIRKFKKFFVKHKYSEYSCNYIKRTHLNTGQCRIPCWPGTPDGHTESECHGAG